MSSELLPLETITHRIVLLRGQKVLLDADLAALYGVETRRLNEQVRRNRERFPADFIFELNAEEFSNLKSHLRHQAGAVAANCRWHLPNMGRLWRQPCSVRRVRWKCRSM